VYLVVVDDAECIELMGEFTARESGLWNDDTGQP